MSSTGTTQSAGHLMYICDHRHRRHFFTPPARHSSPQAQSLAPTRAARAFTRPRAPRSNRHRFAALGHAILGRLLLDRALGDFRGRVAPPDPADLTRSLCHRPAVTGYLTTSTDYQALLAAASKTPRGAACGNYHGTDSLILSIDGLQPEKRTEKLTSSVN